MAFSEFGNALMYIKKSKIKAEFGDFQTPPDLALEVCSLLARKGWKPNSVVEPSCGTGTFLSAALDKFPDVVAAVGLEINPDYVREAKTAVSNRSDAEKTRIIQGSFFDTNWETLLHKLAEPLLVIGNPPWVTNAELGSLGSSNLPEKINFQKYRGLDALTGKSNFDISEWMLLRNLEWIDGRSAVMAMLCKTAVARKVLVHAAKNEISLKSASIYHIDALTHFGAAVDACLLVCHSQPGAHTHDFSVYSAINETKPTHIIGYRDGRLLAELTLYDQWKHLEGAEIYRWRSGIKHDCAKVMELRKEGSSYRNGLSELVELEDEYLFPMLKSSDLANGRSAKPRLRMLVTQQTVGGQTDTIEHHAPMTWRYLQTHGDYLDRRASSIYKNRPRFSIFGVGEYSFAPWKVAISGFYKKLEFSVVGSENGKPIMLDDTSYLVPCQNEDEARYIASLLNSAVARDFYSAFIFWHTKRPITVEILRRLDLLKLSRELGTETKMRCFIGSGQ